jgi:hypothetical protein
MWERKKSKTEKSNRNITTMGETNTNNYETETCNNNETKTLFAKKKNQTTYITTEQEIEAQPIYTTSGNMSNTNVNVCRSNKNVTSSNEKDGWCTTNPQDEIVV